MRPHGSAIDLERRRRKAVALREQGMMPVEISRKLNVDRRSVRRWLSAWRRSGIDALARKPSPGRRPKLTHRQRQGLVKCLLKGASHYGFGTDLWTCRRIVLLIAQRYGQSYHVDSVPRLMAGLGFSPSEAAGSRKRAG